MKQAASAFFVLLLLVILNSSCNDPTLVGSDLLDQDQVNVSSTDTITIRTHTIEGDTVRTYSPFVSSQLIAYLFGNMEDPILGSSKASIYGQVYSLQTEPDLTDITPDSLVLVLPYDTLRSYGTHPQTYGFEVYRVTEDMDNTMSYYSNTSFETEMMPLASLEKNIDPLMAIEEDTSSIAYPHLRIKIEDPDLINTLATDASIYENDTTFVTFFKGLHIVPTLPTSSMLAFNLFDSRAGLKLYYTQTPQDTGDTLREVLQYGFLDESVKMVTFDHRYEDAPVNEFIQNKDLGDSLIFVQGMTGLETVIEFPYTEGYDGIIVNSAIMEIFIADLPGAGDFEPAEQILLSTREDGNNLIIDDVLFSEANLSTLFGGVVVAGRNGEPDKYVLNISTYFQDLIRGQIDNKLYLTIFAKPQRASRSIFYGAGHSTYPVKLNVTFTKI